MHADPCDPNSGTAQQGYSPADLAAWMLAFAPLAGTAGPPSTVGRSPALVIDEAFAGTPCLAPRSLVDTRRRGLRTGAEALLHLRSCREAIRRDHLQHRRALCLARGCCDRRPRLSWLPEVLHYVDVLHEKVVVDAKFAPTRRDGAPGPLNAFGGAVIGSTQNTPGGV